MIRILSEERVGYKILKITGMVIAGIVFAVLIAFLFGYLIQLLWNWLMPELFGLSTITYWQGFGLFLLVKFFFGGLGSHDHKRDHFAWLNHKSFKEWSRKKLKKFYKYWEDEGEEAFENYLKQSDNDQDKSDKEK